MATLYLSEYRFIANVPLDVNYTPVPGQAPQEPSVAEQTVAITGSPTSSAPFSAYTRLIRVNVDSICSIAVGLNPTATTSMKRLAAGQTEYFGVSPMHKLSVIQNV